LLPFAASAQTMEDYAKVKMLPAICGPAEYMFKRTEEMGFGTDPIFTGISDIDNGIATQVVVDETTGKFSVLNWYAKVNVVCVFNNGSNYISKTVPKNY